MYPKCSTVTVILEAQLSQRDRATHYVSRNLINSCKTVREYHIARFAVGEWPSLSKALNEWPSRDIIGYLYLSSRR